MPRLGSLLVCEKIIIDQQQKPTLISVFQSLSAIVPEGQGIPANTVSFIPWAIFAEWFFADDETKGTVEQVIEVLQPDGSASSIRGRVQFQQFAPAGQGTRAYVNLFGMPITQPGYIAVNIWIEVDSKKTTEVFSYQVKIEHSTKPSEPNDGGMNIPVFTQAKLGG